MYSTFGKFKNIKRDPVKLGVSSINEMLFITWTSIQDRKIEFFSPPGVIICTSLDDSWADPSLLISSSHFKARTM